MVDGTKINVNNIYVEYEYCKSMKLIIYENIPCPVIIKEEPDTFLILFKGEQKWIFECSLGYGEIKKNKNGIFHYFNGICHRENGPAVEFFNDSKIWYQNGKLHREDGPALENSIGTKQWFKNGLRHRLDGPAVEYNNRHKEWWVNNNKHRLNGPAIECSDGTKRWYIENIEYSEKKYIENIKKNKL